MRNHDQAMTVLRESADGAAFDASFIQRQIEMHRYLIARIDQILPEVTTKALRQQLEADRAMLEAHLRVAESLPRQ
jgi:predicted outer membrane protein